MSSGRGNLYNDAMDRSVSAMTMQEGGEILRRGRTPASLFGVGDPRTVDVRLCALQGGKTTISRLVAADRFIQLHPGNHNVAYAYYLKALDYYVQIADVARDQKTTGEGAITH